MLSVLLANLLVLENLSLQFGKCVWCVALEIYCIYFHGYLILFLLSINVPLNKILILIVWLVGLVWFFGFCYKMGNKSSGERGRKKEQAWKLQGFYSESQKSVLQVFECWNCESEMGSGVRITLCINKYRLIFVCLTSFVLSVFMCLPLCHLTVMQLTHNFYISECLKGQFLSLEGQLWKVNGIRWLTVPVLHCLMHPGFRVRLQCCQWWLQRIAEEHAKNLWPKVHINHEPMWLLPGKVISLLLGIVFSFCDNIL